MTTQLDSAPPLTPERLDALRTMALRLRRHSVISTTHAGSGHPSSCLSAADLVAVLFFQFLRFDVHNPKNPWNDRFILSKGHAAPLLWAAWAEAGAFPIERLNTLREPGSDLEGHPTPHSKYVDVATGSLGQGLSIGAGMALASRLDRRGNRIYVLMGDGEIAEGSVYEAAEFAGYYRLNTLTAFVDVNGFGQSQATMFGQDADHYAARFAAAGWHTRIIDGHDIAAVALAIEEAHTTEDRPTVILAKTVKGKGVTALETGAEHHGKALKPQELAPALAELGEPPPLREELTIRQPQRDEPPAAPAVAASKFAAPDYPRSGHVATRQAYGHALHKLGAADPRIVALDGDVRNSTMSEEFFKAFPERAFECFIAEQNMMGAAVGLAALGKIPFVATFACFLTRAYDFIRMAGVSHANIKICGSHVGVSIGEDGPSQMGLEDLAMMRVVHGSVVLYPCDGASMERLTAAAAAQAGIVYLRSTRPSGPIIYGADEVFPIGGSKTLRTSDQDRVTLAAAGITVPEALAAGELLMRDGISARVLDLYSVKPLDRVALLAAARETGRIVVAEDHFPEGGLGEAVAATIINEPVVLKHLAVRGEIYSGSGKQLLEQHGLTAAHIATAARELINAGR